MISNRRSIGLIAAVAVLASCQYDKPGGTPPTQPPPTQVTATPPPAQCTAPTIDTDRSLVVHDPALLASAFPLLETMNRIIATSGGATSPEAMLKTLLDSYGATSFVNQVSGKTVPVDARPQERDLVAADLLNPNAAQGMVPIGLFNRLDLAPSDGSNCGEYRIVYGKKSTSPGRLLIIFEAKLINPHPENGLAGCQPVAKFWAELSTEADANKRIIALKKFYYDGLTAEGFGPVVAHANYGLPLGQVRSNLFVEPRWMLREHRTTLRSGVPVFIADTVKNSPLAEWYRASSTLPVGITPADQQAFRANFLNGPACTLLQPDRANPGASAFDIVNRIGANFDPAGDDFQSVSQDDTDDPIFATDAAMTASNDARLTALGVGSVSSEQLLNRAGAMTCGGCHKFSDERVIASGVKWPKSAFFVHITEQGGLSDALTSFFLPRRSQILSRFVCDPTAEQPPTVECLPVPGSAAVGVAAASDTGAVASTVSRQGINPDVEAKLRSGRTSPALRLVDDARLANLAAGQRRRSGPAVADDTAVQETKTADAELDSIVRRARRQEAALKGAFVSVRRTH